VTVAAPDYESRRERAAAALRDAGLDAMILGRPSNVGYLSGARRVLVRGSRPFTPMGVLIAASGDLFLQSANEGGLPPEVTREQLYPMSWNPAEIAASVGALPGLSGRVRVGVDGMTPSTERTLTAALPDASLVPAEDVLRPVCEIWTAGDLESIRAAVDVTAAGIAAVTAAVRPGVSELSLRGMFYAAVAEHGVVTLASEGTVCALGRDGSLRRVSDSRLLGDGDLVALDFAVLINGAEGGLARTVACGASRDLDGLAGRWRRLRDALVAVCRPGATASALRTAYDAAESSAPAIPLAFPLGAGAQPPLSGAEALRDGMVVALQAFLPQPAVGGYLGRDLVAVHADGSELLTA
jgi:Xaa-Pro dipeptidase